MIRPRNMVVGAQFFLFYLGLSTWLPFFNLYLKSLDFSGTQIGIMTACYQGMLFFVVPLWGIIADHKGNIKTMRIALLFTAFILFWVPFQSQFWMLLPYMMILAFFQHPIGSLADSQAIHHIQTRSSGAFGSLRVWGSFGWALGSALMGKLLIDNPLKYTFPMATAMFLIMLLSTFFLEKDEPHNRAGSGFQIKHLLAIFGERQIVYFLFILFLFGIGLAPIYIFINLYFYEIGASNQLIGIAFSVMALSEVPFFFLGRKLVQRFGAQKLLISVMFVAILRLLAYSMVSDPVLAVVLGLAQGFTLSLFWVSSTELMHSLIPQKWRSTGQSLIWAFHGGAGLTIGNLVLGRLLDFYPMRTVMIFAAGFILIIFFLMIVFILKFNPAKNMKPAA